MTASSGGERKIRSILTSLAAALLLAPGCQRDEDTTATAPPNPVPRADLGRPVEPKQHGTDGGGGTGISNVEKDLRKDLGGSPVIKPDAPATTVPPTAKPDGARTGTP